MKGWFTPVVTAVAASVLLGPGCGRQDPIRHYEVRKPQPDQRLLGAIVPRGERAWFFKVTGPPAALQPWANDFVTLVKSLKFAADPAATPHWTLPSGWKQKEGAGFRFATLELPSQSPPLEVSVTQLPLPPGDPNQYVLSNLNLWREQLGLRPIEAEQLKASVTSVPLSDSPETVAMLVDLTGHSPRAGGHGQMPMATAAADSAESAAAPLQYSVPEGWREGHRVISRGGIAVRRDAAFEAQEDDQRVEITITSLPAATNPVLSNVNRWRRQIELPDITQEQLAKETATLTVAGVPAQYVQLIGPRETILGVIVVRQETAWFVKLQGDAKLAKREQQKFESFAQSLRFE